MHTERWLFLFPYDLPAKFIGSGKCSEMDIGNTAEFTFFLLNTKINGIYPLILAN